MSANESTSEDGWKFNKAASVAVTEPAAIVDNRKDFTISVSEELAEIFKLIFNMIIVTRVSECNKERSKKINGISSKMDILYYDIIDTKDPKMDEIAVLAESYLYLSYIHVDDKEIILAVASITKCTELLKGKELNHKCILTAVNAYYQLGFLHHKRDNQESLSAYNKAFQIYLSYTKQGGIYSAPFYIPSYFDLKQSNSKDMLDKKSALSTQVLMKEYTNLDIYTLMDQIHIDKIVTYQHKILDKKLNSLSSSADYYTWAILAGSLCEYFIKHDRFTEARDHLAAASFIINKFYKEMHMKMDQLENCDAESESKMYVKFQGEKLTSVLIATHWARYGIKLLYSSKKKILHGTEDKLCAVCNSKLLSLVHLEMKLNKLLLFANMREDLEKFTTTITDKYVTDYIDANILFETVMKHLNHIKAYYTFEEHPTLYVSIILNISRIHKHLAFYVDRSDKLKLHKQNLDILLTTLEKIKFKCNFYVRPILIEAITTANDTLDVICENSRLHSNQLEISTAESIKELSNQIKEILKSCMKVCSNIYLNSAN